MGQICSLLQKLHNPYLCPVKLLPPEIRVDAIMSLLSPKDRQSLRLTCSQLLSEIDEYFGGSDTLYLHDQKSAEALEFYGRSAFREVIIYKTCFLNFDEVIYSPERIHTLKLEGIILVEFATSLLQNCRSLKTLVWNGIIKDQLPDPTPMKLNKLTTADLRLIYKPEVGSGVTFAHLDAIRRTDHVLISSWMLHSWLNQLTILKNINCPRAETINLSLWSWADRPRYVDNEAQLSSALSNCLNHLAQCKTLKLVHGQCYCPELRTRRAVHPLSRHIANLEGNDLMDSEIKSPVANPNLREISFVSDSFWKGEGSNLDTYVLSFISSVKSLEILVMKLRELQPLEWRTVAGIVSGNYLNLTHLEIINITPAVTNEAIDFGPFKACNSIRVIKIGFDPILNENLFDGNGVYLGVRYCPWIINFGPHSTFVKNLETLILQNVRLQSENLKQIHLLRNLKYLGICGWAPSTPGFLTREGVRSILKSRSLKGLLIRPGNTHNPANPEIQVLLNACRILYPSFEFQFYEQIVIEISNPDNPWWIGSRIVHSFESDL